MKYFADLCTNNFTFAQQNQELGIHKQMLY